MNAQELKDRTKHFALRVMHLVDALPETPKGRAVASQLVRSGMSVAANYRAACRGRSHAEFISKIGVVEDKLLPEKKIAPLLKEANELTAIMAGLVHFRVAQQTRCVSKFKISNPKSAVSN